MKANNSDMHIKDAARILNLNGEITPEIVKKAYREAAFKYHPDRNPAGAEMMKLVNSAYKTLKNHTGTIEHNAENYGEELNKMINVAIAIRAQSANTVTIELMGTWLWVTGETKQYSHLLNRKTGAGFSYASKKKAWYFRPDDYKSRSRGKSSLEDIRGKYGSVQPNGGQGYHLT